MPNKNLIIDFNDFDQQLKDSVIMMVDDESINTDMIQIHLEDAGYKEFIITNKSDQAMELLRKERPDVLLLDLNMPGITGFDILQEVRADIELKHMPVIILTSSSEAETKLKALELGATDFLSKPADPSEMMLRLRNTLTVKAYQNQLAYYDHITGLPNRRLFLDRLDWAIKDARREKTITSVLHIVFDQLKQINDTLGPRIGEMLIQEISVRLKECLRDNDAVTQNIQDSTTKIAAHLGDGEFTVLLQKIGQTEDAAIVAKRILAVINDVVYIEENDIQLNPSVGISIFPTDGEKAEELLTFASSASNHAQQQDSNNYLFYSKDINEKSLQRIKLTGLLRKAIDNGEMQLYYQPKIETQSNKVAGMEALIRWISPELGFVSPVDFIPLAEETGLIIQIGEWVLYEACRQNMEWQKQGLKGLTVSVNVSGIQLVQQDFSKMVSNILESSGLDPRCLVLEMTESVIMNNPEKIIKLLQQLKRLKLSISIDDFGTGYSSLSYLKKFPLDELKIDRSFIIEIDDDDDDKAIVTAVIAMAHSLGLKVVAEGVEDESQLNFLRTLDCEQIQGFYFSKPLPKEEFAKFVMQNHQ